MAKQAHNPPPLAVKLITWLVKPELQEEILGDLYEYHTELANQPQWKHNLFGWFQAFNFLRPFALKTPWTHYQIYPNMFIKNYYKTSVRSLRKNPLSTFINLFGLSAAIGICILVYGFAAYTFNTDQFHEHKNEVYLTTFFSNRAGGVQEVGTTPRPLGKLLRNDFAQIEQVCRIDDYQAVVKQGNRVFHEQIRYVDPEFLTMFTFPLKWGQASSLADANTIILSENTAIKYFGQENPVGKPLQVIAGAHSKTYTVGGVAAAFPSSCTFAFGLLIHYNNLRTTVPDYEADSWAAQNKATFVKVNNPNDLPAITSRMQQYAAMQSQAMPDWPAEGYGFVPLASLHKRASSIRNDISFPSDGNYMSVIFLSVIAAILLTLACSNYVNIAIVSAAKRMKEIGLRKVVGASRGMVVFQFLGENLLITAIAIVFGLILGAEVVIPWFEHLNTFNMGFNILNPTLYLYLLGVLLVTGLAAGLYPSMYVSRFQVISIMKGSIRFGQKNRLTKTLLGFQLVLACILIASAVMFTQNSWYMANRSWGYNQYNALYTPVPGQDGYQQLSAAMGQHPDVLTMAGSAQHFGVNQTNAVITQPKEAYEVDALWVGPGYLKTMGSYLVEGRLFDATKDQGQPVVVINQLAAQKIGLQAPLGQTLIIDSVRHTVVGVVKNIHNFNFFDQMQPMVFRVASQSQYQFLSMRVRPGRAETVYHALQQQWATLFPETPFQGQHQVDTWGDFFQETQGHSKFWQGIAYITIFLAALGLYGLVTLNVAGRTKEFSIRKVLGARVQHLAGSIIKQYVVLFAIALVTGAVLSYFWLDFIFDIAYLYHMPTSPVGVVVGVTALAGVLLLVVSTQLRLISRANPASGLRTE